MNRILRICFGICLVLGQMKAGLAADLRTISPRVLEEPVWTFPPVADHEGVRRGEARAMLSISATGELVDFLVVGCTHPAFAEAVAEAMQEYRFAPARVRGEVRPVRQLVTFSFEKGGTVGSLQFDDVAAVAAGSRGVTGPAMSMVSPPSLLDQPLVTTRVVQPRYPDELRSQAVAGEVKVDFFVDGAGRVRLPAVDTDAHPSFAREAASALMEWQFEPPTRGGRPTMVKVEQTFRFPAPVAVVRK